MTISSFKICISAVVFLVCITNIMYIINYNKYLLFWYSVQVILYLFHFLIFMLISIFFHSLILGRILLKGDNITLLMNTQPSWRLLNCYSRRLLYWLLVEYVKFLSCSACGSREYPSPPHNYRCNGIARWGGHKGNIFHVKLWSYTGISVLTIQPCIMCVCV